MWLKFTRKIDFLFLCSAAGICFVFILFKTRLGNHQPSKRLIIIFHTLDSNVGLQLITRLYIWPAGGSFSAKLVKTRLYRSASTRLYLFNVDSLMKLAKSALSILQSRTINIINNPTLICWSPHVFPKYLQFQPNILFSALLITYALHVSPETITITSKSLCSRFSFTYVVDHNIRNPDISFL